MYDSDFRIRIAKILVYGHIILFVFGIFVVASVPSKFEAIDFAHVMLMGFPVIAATSLAAFSYVVRGRSSRKRGRKIKPEVVQMTTVVCVAAIAISLAVLSLPMFEGSGISVDLLKVIIGVVETFLGGYLGIVSDNLFPSQDPEEG